MEKKTISQGNIFAGKSYAVLMGAFMLCLVIQVYFAGLAIFAQPVYWASHISFIHFFEFIPLIMLAIAFFGRLPQWTRWQSVILIGLVFALYFTANFRAAQPLAAIHPVIAMALFWVTLKFIKRSFGWLKRPQTSTGEAASREDGGKGVKTWIFIGSAALAGLVAGLVLSQLIGIMGYFLLDRPLGIKYLPLYLAIAFPVIASIWSFKKRN